MKNSVVTDSVEVVTKLNKTMPIYKDGLQPAVKEVGKSLKTISKFINVALLPMNGLIWGAKELESFVKNNIPKKMKNIPKKNLIEASPEIVIPSLQTISYRGYDKNISDIIASLISTSMDKDTVKYAHPSFITIINQLCSDEVKLLKLFSDKFYIAWKYIETKEFPEESNAKIKNNYKISYNGLEFLLKQAGIEHHDLFESYLENLQRLNLIYKSDRYKDKKLDSFYSIYEDFPKNKKSKKVINKIISYNTKYKDIIEEWTTGDGAITKYNHENGEKIKQKGQFDFLQYEQNYINASSYGKKFLIACFGKRPNKSEEKNE